MRKLLLNPTPLFRKLRQLSLLLSLLLAFPQTAWGDSYFTINYSTAGNPLNQVWVSDDNLSDVLGDGTMSYDKTNNVLTLNGIDLELSPDDTGCDLISCQDTNDHPSLTIKLAGTNKVTLGNHNPGFFYGKELTFIIDAGNPGSLTISTQDEWGGNLFENSFSGEPTIDPTYSNELSLTQKGHTYIIKTPSTGYIDYGITIGDTPVTSENKDNFFGDGTISFTPATGSNPTNTLTLRETTIGNANTPHGITVTNLANLTIICAGDNNYSTINSSGTPIYCTDNSCDLTFTSEQGYYNFIQFNQSATVLVDGFKSETYVADKAEQFLPQKQIGFITYDILFQNNQNTGNVQLNTKTRTFDRSLLDSSSFAVLSGGGFTFDPATCTLTILDGTRFGRFADEQLQQSAIYTEIRWGVNEDLKVVINGDCQIIGGVDGNLTFYPFHNINLKTYQPNAGCKISFEKGTGVTNANLALVGVGSTKASLFEDFAESDISWTNDLEWVSGLPVENSASISATYDDITIAGAPVTVAAGKAGITPEGGSGKVYFDGANNILTLDGANVTGMIKTGLENLTIKLKGTNTIVTSSNNNGIYSDKNTGTLTFTKEGTGASLNITSGVSVIRGFASLNLENSGLYTRSSTPYKMKSNAGYTRLADATKEETDTTAITSFYISESVTYQLWVAGNQVTGANVTGTNIAGTVTFNTTNNTLTLSGANIIGTIESSLGDLTIHLTGGNTIKATGSETSLINSTNAGTVTFETDATTGNQLSFLKSDAGYFGAIPINGFTVAYEAGLGYNSQFSKIIESLTIEYNDNTYKLHSSNANNIVGDGKVSYSYDSTNGSVLTLNNGNVGHIEWKISDNLTIAINGTCSVSNTGHTNAINSNGNGDVSFVKASGASNAELTLKWGSGNDPVAAPNSTLGSGLYWKPIAATQRIITDNPEFVIVGDYAISDGIPVNGTTSGTITYNATDKLLTISSFSQTFAKDAIKTSVSGLKVKLVGASTITCNDNDGRAFTATTASASIQFVKNDADSKLTMNTTYDPLYNFATGAITYDGLYYYGVSINQYIIKPKNSPTIKFVVRDQDNNGSIPANQSDYVYVPDNGIQIPYATSYYAPKPEFNDGYALSDSTRYEYTMSVDGVVEFALGGTSQTTQGNPGKIAYADDGKLNILQSGELTITCTFPGNLQNEPCSASYTLKITRVFNNPFANTPAEQIYATYYNENEDLALPDGIVAYVVTGVSGNSVTTTATGYLPQNTAVLLEKTGLVGTTVTGYTGSAGNFNSNLLKYTSANAVVNTTGKEYILYKNEFVKATGNISGSCYLDLSGTNLPARGVLGIGNDGSTGIEGIDVEATKGEEWYDLQGRRIQQPMKAGIYIVNGKKVIINKK